MDFYSTFMSLRIFLPEPLAYRVTERGKRGMKDTSFQGGMTKGFHYISGREKIKKYIEEGKDLSILYVGKIGIGDIDIVKRLKEKGIIKDPVCLPEFV